MGEALAKPSTFLGALMYIARSKIAHFHGLILAFSLLMKLNALGCPRKALPSELARNFCILHGQFQCRGAHILSWPNVCSEVDHSALGNL